MKTADAHNAPLMGHFEYSPAGPPVIAMANNEHDRLRTLALEVIDAYEGLLLSEHGRLTDAERAQFERWRARAQ